MSCFADMFSACQSKSGAVWEPQPTYPDREPEGDPMRQIVSPGYIERPPSRMPLPAPRPENISRARSAWALLSNYERGQADDRVLVYLLDAMHSPRIRTPLLGSYSDYLAAALVVIQEWHQGDQE